jgi:hypothetical protein
MALPTAAGALFYMHYIYQKHGGKEYGNQKEYLV